ncbi:hypothetical protein IWW48_000891 [Coemansia sp. RSA 1200]|nr:hypothetical protein IWW48_000891 [Coemansia sp. RSA 1200]
MAHRLVFNDVYIESLENGGTRLKTNAGLYSATKVGAMWGPKRLTLLVDNGDGDIELAIAWAMTVLETYQQTAGQIENLRLEFSGNSNNNPTTSSNTSSSAHRAFRQTALHTVAGIMSLAGQLVRLLPRVKAFKFSVGKVDKGATMFGYVVARHYAKQLAYLDTNSVLCFPGAGFEGQHLTLRTNIVGARLPRNSNRSNSNDYAGTQPPRIEPKALERLHLSRVDYRFDWRVFLSCGGNSSSVDGGVIGFPKLKHVVVETSAAPARPPSNALPGYLTNMTINAPLLQSWRTEVTPFACLLLWAASGATRLQQQQQQQQQMQKPHIRRYLDILWLDCMDGTELTLRNVDIYKLAQTAIQKYALRRMGATIGGVELGNDVFGTRLASHLAAIIRGATLSEADVARMRWTYIDSLEIKARISWNALKGLIARTPYLTDLKAHCVTDVPQAVVSDIEWQTVRGTRIRRAWIRIYESAKEEDSRQLGACCT